MKNVLKSKKGETLIEVMVSLVVAVVIISMLPVSIEAAARINAKVKNIATLCSMDNPAEVASYAVGIYSKSGTEEAQLENLSSKVKGYTEDGFYYYELVTPSPSPSPST